MDEVYERLADALNKLPNSFPRTQSNVEIPLLKKIFSPEEASIASRLGREMKPLRVLAKRFGLSAEDAKTKLLVLSGRRLLWQDSKDGERRFRLAPFIVGIFEAQLDKMDHEFAHLLEEYFADGGLAGIMRPQPTIHRVVPAYGAVKTEWVLPYDDVRAILLSQKTFGVVDCICRTQQDQIGRKCDFPLNICLNFSSRERRSRPSDITKEEALALLDKAEEIGLVHTVSNVMKGVGYVCNCCGCCCGIIRAFTEFGVDNSILAANYYAEIDSDLCVGCGICVDRCQMKAIKVEKGVASVNLEECIGCGHALVLMIHMFFSSIAGSYWVIHAKDVIGLTEFEWGSILLAASIIPVLFSIPVGMLLDKFDKNKIIASAMVISTIPILVFPYSNSFMDTLIIFISIATSEAFLFPGAMALLADLAPKENRGSTMAALGRGMLAMTGAGGGPGMGFLLTFPSVLGYLFGGLLYTSIGTFPWILLGISTIINALILAFTIKT